MGICVRNAERLLRNAVESIAEQDYPHEIMEIIFVDDGSQDGTYDLILNLSSKLDIKTKIFRTNWQGLGSARNIVVDNAEGKYVIWVDADEVLARSYISDQIKILERNGDVGLTAGIFELIPNKTILNLELIPAIIDHLRFNSPRSLIWKTTKLPGTGGTTFRVDALKQVKGFDDKLTGVGEDQDVAIRVCNAGWSIQLNNSGFYETHGGLSTWPDLFKKYKWYGQGNFRLYRKNNKAFSLARMSPFAGFATGFFYSLESYKLLNSKRLFFLLPLHFGLKMFAWTVGFMSKQFASLR